MMFSVSKNGAGAADGVDVGLLEGVLAVGDCEGEVDAGTVERHTHMAGHALLHVVEARPNGEELHQ